MKRQYIPWLIAAGFALLFLATLVSNSRNFNNPLLKPASSGLQNIATPSASPEFLTNKVKVTRVIDGDTIETEKEGVRTRVRYTGIDTPEPGDCFGSQASRANSDLVLGKEVSLETDVQVLDKYGRTLAYVWLDNTLVNEELVRQGFARVSTYPPNVKYQIRFVTAEREAREAKRGLWEPDVCVQRELQANPASTDKIQGASAKCAIKGNISSSGEKIYHSPGQRFYEKTQVDEATGERWFCSESEAEAAGWRKSKV